jgi:aryl-alcohol dehydrogenase-like predicted oxidoreductase
MSEGKRVNGAVDTFNLDSFTINRMGFGAMRLTGEGIWGEPEDPEEARAVLRRAVEHLEENLAAVELRLSDEELATLS